MMARLELALAAARLCVWKKTSSSGSLFIRRSTTLAEADVWKKKSEADVWKKKSESEKSLYLCFREVSEGVGVYDVTQVVRPIRLNSDDDAGKEEEEYVSEAAYQRCEGFWKCSRFGSQILFPFSRHINRVDTSTRPIKFEDSCIEFSSPKIDPVLVELNGKLYCIDKDNPSCPFEVLDDGLNWRPLDKPHFSMKHRRRPVSSSIVGKSNKILGWVPKENGPPCVRRERFGKKRVYSSNSILGWVPNESGAGTKGSEKCVYSSILEESNKILSWVDQENGVFCFDPEKNGWTESSFGLSNALPFLGYNGRPPTFIHSHHPHLGAFYIIFDYHPYNKPPVITPFFMSRDCDSFQPIKNKPIQLPAKLCFPFYSFITDYQLVHLGGQKVCFVLNKFFSDDPVQGRDTGILLILTFEYDVKPSKSSILNIQTRFLGTHRFRYHSKPADDKKIYSHSVDLTDAYVL